MQINVEVEKPSSILRKIKVRIPAQEVNSHFEKGLSSVQKTANLKGFRPGHAPLSIVKQFYGNDVRHRVYHQLIEQSFEEAVREQALKTVGQPKIQAEEESKTGEGEHDHTLREDHDLTYVATVEVMPELNINNFKGLSIKKEDVSVTDEQVEKVIENLRNSYAELVPASGGITLADGKESSRPVQKGDFADLQFQGGVLTETGIDYRDDMKGTRVLEIGSGSFIPGFEDEVIGMRRGETKSFQINFPNEYSEKDLQGKRAEFTVTINEVKEKKLPALDDEFAKQSGHESLDDLHRKAREFLVKERTNEVDHKLRSDLVNAILENNKFEVPQALIEAQLKALVQEWIQELKKQGYQEKLIHSLISNELENLRKRAESQVRASLILEDIAKQENISVSPSEIDDEILKMAANMQVEEEKLNHYFTMNPKRKDDLEFRLRQERTIQFLLSQSKIDEVKG